MLRFPFRIAWARRHAPTNQPSFDGTRRRDWLRGLVGIPVLLMGVSAALGSQSGCVYDTTGTRNLGETEVDVFQVNQDHDTLEHQLHLRAEFLGLDLAWHDSVAPDQVDAKSSVAGRRLTRWDYRSGQTETRFYRFEVYRDGDGGDPLDESQVTLSTVLKQGWQVRVVEVQNPLTTTADE